MAGNGKIVQQAKAFAPVSAKAWCVPPATLSDTPYCNAFNAQSMVPLLILISRSTSWRALRKTNGPHFFYGKLSRFHALPVTGCMRSEYDVFGKWFR